MSYWLLKTEPDCFSWDDLVRDGKTTWDGVTNALALKHMRAMSRGDLALIYHTADERSVVGVAEIVGAPRAAGSGDPRHVVVDLRPKSSLKRAVPLGEIRADPAFAGWDLIRNSRLGVMPVPPGMWKRIHSLAKMRQSTRTSP
ncbi:MAG: EVE domain-containing protein [Tepidisphaeraceae bacterium]